VPVAPELVMASCFDCWQDTYLRELVHVARAALDQIYVHCDGYPAPGAPAAAVLRYLREHVAPSAAYYVGNPRRSVPRIRAEALLHNMLEVAVDDVLAKTPVPRAHPLVDALRVHVRTTPELRWALVPPASPPFAWYRRHYGRLAALVVAALILLPVLLPALVALLILLHLAQTDRGSTAEANQPIADDSEAAQKRLDALVALEDAEVQNQMTLITPIKPGRLRLFTLRAVCWVIQLRATYWDTHGSLGGIPSIHFAHWNVIDGGRRLLFCSNYDGTWEAYLGDFIDRAASALTAIWSNCIDFPHTSFLVIGGARDEQRFKAWIRRFQIPTDVWYPAYPRLSVQNIQNSSGIREGLLGDLNDGERAAWLRRL